MKCQLVILFALCLLTLTDARSASKFKVAPEVRVPAKDLSLAQIESSQVTTTSRKSWGDNISDAITGFIIGVLLIFTMPALLWFNEKRSVDVVKEIMKAEKIVKECSADSVDATLENELVHLAGETQNLEAIVDPFFNVSVDASIRLQRTVWAYQVVEHVHETKERDIIGGGTTTTKHYTYSNEWRDHPVNSSLFQDINHQNDNSKVKFIADFANFNGKRVTIGVHALSESQINQLDNFETFNLVGGTENNLGEEAKTAIAGLGWEHSSITTENNSIHIKHVKGSDNIGDLRVEFKYIKCQPISFLAQQQGDSFAPYPIRERMEKDAGCFEKCLEGCQGCCTSVFCYSPCCQCVQKAMEAPTHLDWIYPGNYDVKAIAKKREEENDSNTKVIRLVGLILLILGFFLLFQPIIAFLSIVSFLGDIFAVAALIVSILVGLALGLTVIAISWIFYRPLYGILLLTIVGSIIYFIIYASEQGAKEQGTTGFLQLN